MNEDQAQTINKNSRSKKPKPLQQQNSLPSLSTRQQWVAAINNTEENEKDDSMYMSERKSSIEGGKITGARKYANKSANQPRENEDDLEDYRTANGNSHYARNNKSNNPYLNQENNKHRRQYSIYSDDSSRDFTNQKQKQVHGTEEIINRGDSGTTNQGDDDLDTDNQSQYFQVEEKVIKNHLKLNFSLQIILLVVFLFATWSLEWIHILIGTNPSGTIKQFFHVSLLQMTMEDMRSSAEFTDDQNGNPSVYLFTLSDQCHDQISHPSDTKYQLYPRELCDRSGSLFLSGTLSFVGLFICWLLNLYNSFSILMFVKRFQLTSLQYVFIKYVPYLYMCICVFYFVVSLSFVYLSQIAIGQYLCLIGALVSLFGRRHFIKQYKRINHMMLVKTLVSDSSNPTVTNGSQGQY